MSIAAADAEVVLMQLIFNVEVEVEGWIA